MQKDESKLSGLDSVCLNVTQRTFDSATEPPSMQPSSTQATSDKASLEEYCILFGMLFDASADTIAITDHLARLIYINPQALKAINLSLEQVKGRTGVEMFPEDVAVRSCFNATQQVIVSGKSKSLLLNSPQYSLARPLYDVLNITPFIDKQQRVLGTMIIGRESTQDRVLENDEVKRRERYQRALLDNFPFMVWLKDNESRFLASNAVFASVVGAGSSHDLEGKTDFDFFPEELARKYVENDLKVLHTGESVTCVELIRKNNGDAYWAETYKSPVSIDDKLIGTVGFSRDISEHRQLLSDIAKKELEYAALVKSLPLSIIRYDLNCKRLFVNANSRDLDPESEYIVMGKSPKESWSVDIKNMTADQFQSRLQDVMRSSVSQNFELYVEKNERNNVYMMSVFPEFNEFNQVVGALTLCNDITEISQYRQRLEHLAFHDPLTDLPNRTLLNERMQLTVRHAARNKSLFGLFFLDLDCFKSINDTLGHGIGDELLVEAAKRILSCVRSSDVVARIGGDEFAVLVTDIYSHQDLAGLANKISVSLATPFHIGGSSLFVTASTGIACYPSDSEDIEDLIKFADTAMYHAKNNGRNNYQFYSAELTFSVTEHLMIETALRYAIEKNELTVDYQPIVDMVSRKILGAEALLRWTNDVLGSVEPDKFIPIAEDSGLIIEIGAWVLHEACMAAVTFNQNKEAPFVISVNLSSRQFVRHDIYATLAECLKSTGCQPQWITLEIKESLLLQDGDELLKKLTQLHNLGVTLAIDDFGTGYSALACLSKFPIAQLKIDREFMDNVLTNQDNNAALLVKTIVAMAQSLNKDLVAEGIETKEQMTLLNSFGCHQAQGFLFSHPLPFFELCSLLDNQSPKLEAYYLS